MPVSATKLKNTPAALPRRVLMVIEAGGGAVRQVLDLSEGLIARGHRVSLVYSGRRAEPWHIERARRLGFEHLVDMRFRRPPVPTDVAGLARLRRFLATAGPFDVVHAHSSKAGALARVAASGLAARVYTPHAFKTSDPLLRQPGRALFGAIEAGLGGLTDALVAVSPEEADHAVALGIDRQKVHIVPNGVAPFHRKARARARAELGIAPDKVAVGFVGRLTTQKDPLRFCAAISAARQTDPRIIGVMVGDGELAAQVRAARAPVLALGRRDAADYMNGFDVLAMTSRYEGMPYVLLEALHAGLPIVSTAVGGSGLLVRPGENGWIVARDASPTAIGQTLALLANPSLRQRMSQASRRLAPQFSAERMVAGTARVYELAIARQRASVRSRPAALAGRRAEALT